MKDPVFSRASGWEGKAVPKADGKGHEVSFPKATPGETATHRPAKSLSVPHTKSNTKD